MKSIIFSLCFVAFAFGFEDVFFYERPTLEAILNHKASINQQWLSIGESKNGITLLSISQSCATIKSAQEQITICLQPNPKEQP